MKITRFHRLLSMLLVVSMYDTCVLSAGVCSGS